MQRRRYSFLFRNKRWTEFFRKYSEIQMNKFMSKFHCMYVTTHALIKKF